VFLYIHHGLIGVRDGPRKAASITNKIIDKYIKMLFHNCSGDNMDKFDETAQMFKNMSLDERMTRIHALAKRCACGSCPSYTECAKNDSEGIFCLKGTSFRCINEVKGCNCPSCDVEKDLSMKDNMYCINGSEFVNRYMEKM
jgi:hypothetical protein